MPERLNDWWIEGEPFNGSGNQFSARLTGLPVWSADGLQYLHLGVSARYSGANDGTLRFRGRPKSNVSSYYLDSGELTADHANELGLEAIASSGPFFFTSEFVRANVDACNGRSRVLGTYVTASYVLTGEHRPYDRAVAYARRIMPRGRWGAWEVVMRYSHVDIDDAEVRGGIFDRGTVGLTWWATRHWRLSIDYGLIDLDRSGKHGITQTVHPRFQWVY